MFVSAGLRSARVGHNAPWQSMFLILLVSVFVLVFAGLVLIPLESVDDVFCKDLSSNQLCRVAKRYFFSGKGDSSSNGGSSGGQGTDVASGQFSYKTAVAYQPKDRDDPIYKRLKSKLNSPTGEDNFFLRMNGANDLYAGVADGVGGWAEHGYDSSAISRELCRAMDEFSSLAVHSGASVDLEPRL